MKITKKQLALFEAIYIKMMYHLSTDLHMFRKCAMQTLKEHDLKVLNLDDPQEIESLAKMFLLHRIEEFNGYENGGESALREAREIIESLK